MSRASLLLGLWALVGAAVGCTSPAQGFCNASADCNATFADFIPIPDAAGDADDSAAVCAALQQGQLNAYRANTEPSCQEVANTMEAYFACIGAAFAKDPDGCDVIEDECTDERDDWQDAVDDVDGDECSSNED